MEPKKIKLDSEQQAAVEAMERDLSETDLGKKILPLAKNIYLALLEQPNDQMALMNICCSLAANTYSMNALAESSLTEDSQIVHNIVNQVEKLTKICEKQTEILEKQKKSITALQDKTNH